METMPIKERDNNHIVFQRTQYSTTLGNIHYPYYLTTPYTPPREIVYRFEEPPRGMTEVTADNPVTDTPPSER